MQFKQEVARVAVVGAGIMGSGIAQLAAMAGYEVTLCDMAPEQLNPVVLMRLVEVVRGLQTSDATVAAARQFARTLGKDTVVCQKDSPGFLLEDLIAAGRLGCTTGHGIYDHDERGAYPPPAPS